MLSPMSLLSSARVKTRLALARVQGGYGHVALEGGRVVGWAWASGQDLPEVEMRVAGKPVHSFKATHARADLQALGLPSSARGFSISLQALPLPMIATDVDFALRTRAGGSAALRGSPIRLAGVAVPALQKGLIQAAGPHLMAGLEAAKGKHPPVLRHGRDRLMLAARAAAAIHHRPLDGYALRSALDAAITGQADEDQALAALLHVWRAWAERNALAALGPDPEALSGPTASRLDAALEIIHDQIAASYRAAVRA
jgi:hypothetical protein